MAVRIGGRSAGMDPRGAPNVFLWLDADRLPSVPDDTVITNWPNRHGSASDAANDGAPSRRPVYIQNGGNGKPGVRFEASALGGTHGLDCTAGFSCYAVAKETALPVGTYGWVAGLTPGTFSRGNGIYREPGGSNGWNFFEALSDYLSSFRYAPTVSTNEFHVFAMVAKPRSTLYASVDGYSGVTYRADRVIDSIGWNAQSGASLDATNTGYIVGGLPASAGEDFRGIITDIVYANEAHSPAVARAVIQFLAAKNRVILKG